MIFEYKYDTTRRERDRDGGVMFGRVVMYMFALKLPVAMLRL
jgi:hypothetical protein